jgi:hypothetical protein
VHVRPPDCLGGDDTVYGLGLGCVAAGAGIICGRQKHGGSHVIFSITVNSRTRTATL